MKTIKLFKPYVSWLSRIYALKVLMGTQLAEGPVVKQFEYEFAKTFQKDNVVAVNSGTSALELAYELAGVGPGDEVITPVLTCTATNLPIIHRGAQIVFADIDDDLNISIEDVQRKITPKTKAIVFVHFGGNSRGLRQLLVLAREYNIRVIEDAAQSIGTHHEKWGLADYTCISFQAIKTLTAGDGGMLICKDPDDYQRARRLRWFGYDRDKKQKEGDTDLIEAGYKYHMNDISAAIGLGNLRSLDTIMRKRLKVRDWYFKELNEQSLTMPHSNKYFELSFRGWLMILSAPDIAKIEKQLKHRGITVGQYHYRNDKYSVFAGADARYLLTMDRVENNYLLLPFHHDLSRKDVQRVMKEVVAAL